MVLERIRAVDTSPDTEFSAWAAHILGGESIRQCLQCGTCSGNCPLAAFMDYTPRRLVQLSREGYKREVLGSKSIWLCTSCYACVVQCPQKINVTGLMYALKRRAIQERLYPKRFPIPVMAREFSAMVRSRGRITESWLVVRVFLQTAITRLLGMSGLGMRLLRSGRMSFVLETVKRRREVTRLVDAVAAASREVA